MDQQLSALHRDRHSLPGMEEGQEGGAPSPEREQGTLSKKELRRLNKEKRKKEARLRSQGVCGFVSASGIDNVTTFSVMQPTHTKY